MIAKLTIGCFILALTGQMAVADVVDDCHRNLIAPEVRVRACTEIIESPSFRPDEKARAYISRGEARTDAGAIPLALADFAESIRIKKDNMEAFAGRGRAELVAGNLTGSIADYSEAIRLSPASAQLYIERGHVYLVSGRPDAAIRDTTEAIRLNPGSAIALNERGIAYFRKGDLEAAQKDLSAAIAMVPFPEMYVNRGRVEEALGRNGEAIQDFRRALLDDPSLVEAEDALTQLGAGEAIATDTDQRVRQGEALAKTNCSRCHAVGVDGDSPNKDAPKFRDLNRRHPLYWLRAPTAQGIQATHEKMPDFHLSFEDLDTIVAYIYSLSPVAR